MLFLVLLFFILSGQTLVKGSPEAMMGMKAVHLSPAPPVMGSHLLMPKRWVFFQQFMFMQMDGNREARREVSLADVLSSYPVSPSRMKKQMISVGGMYGMSRELTLMTMLPLQSIWMDHITRTGVRFRTRSSGLGDLKLVATYGLLDRGHAHIFLTTGVSVPTGSIERRDTLPSGKRVKLPYPMQLGSGTFDLLPGISFVRDAGEWAYGSQLSGIVRLGRNDHNYHDSHKFFLTLWGARRLSKQWTTSLRAEWKNWSNVHGADPELDPTTAPTADPRKRGGHRVDLLFKVGFQMGKSRLNAEVGMPLFQYLSGPQLETKQTVQLQWMTMF